MDHYLGVAKEEGITDDEIGAVLAIVMAVHAGRVRAQVREVRSRKTKKKEQEHCSTS
jgi:alkylhydroperoxidase/carboxymuconolactone decarboxylase family protein YurZ